MTSEHPPNGDPHCPDCNQHDHEEVSPTQKMATFMHRAMRLGFLHRAQYLAILNNSYCPLCGLGMSMEEDTHRNVTAFLMPAKYDVPWYVYVVWYHVDCRLNPETNEHFQKLAHTVLQETRSGVMELYAVEEMPALDELVRHVKRTKPPQKDDDDGDDQGDQGEEGAKPA